MNRLSGSLLVLCVVATWACQTKNEIQDPIDHLPTTGYEKEIVDEYLPMTEEDRKDPKFIEAVGGVINLLNDNNDCIQFQLVNIQDAAKWAGDRIEYRLGLIVQPRMGDSGDAKCHAVCITDAIKAEQVVEASFVVQPEKTPKHSIELLATPGIASKFGSDGEMFLDCTPTLPPTLQYGWSQMTRDELESEQFKNAVNEAIAELNVNANECFRHELDYVLEGRTKAEPAKKQEWLMKVHRIYDDDLPGCQGRCADECSGIDTFKGNAEFSTQNGATINVKLAN